MQMAINLFAQFYQYLGIMGEYMNTQINSK